MPDLGGSGVDLASSLRQTPEQGAAGGGGGGQGQQQAADVRRGAQEGTRGSGGKMPHADKIAKSFGPGHGVESMQAHVGGAAGAAARQMGARGFATDGKAGFDGEPDAFLAGHEAAHLKQQEGGAAPAGGVSSPGDPLEQEADEVGHRVAAGKPAGDILAKYEGGSGGGGGGVQRSVVQMGVLDDVRQGASDLYDRGRQAVGEVVEAGRQAVQNFIDLQAAKLGVVNKLRDGSWMRTAVTGVDMDAHPDHLTMMRIEIELLMMKVRGEALLLGMRLQTCNTLPEVQALSAAVDAWKTARAVSLKAEVEAKIEEYRQDERDWLTTYGKAKHAGEVTPNKGAHGAHMQLDGGMKSKVTVTTRVNFQWKLTEKAAKLVKAKKLKDWNDQAKQDFVAGMNNQLQQTWGKGAGIPPFRMSRPSDHLLKKEGQKWSGVVATFAGQVEAKDAGGHHTIPVYREAPGENGRAFSNLFYEQNATSLGGLNADQHTLAHEWGHWMNLPDEYAASSAEQKKLTDARKDRYTRARAYYEGLIAANAGDSAKEKKIRAQAESDLRALDRPYQIDPATGQRRIYGLADNNRPDGAIAVPDDAFATWGGQDQVYRAGGLASRGGLFNATEASDEARLMVSGNSVEPYYYEGILEALNGLVAGKNTPEIGFEHNFKEMSKKQIADIILVRTFNSLRDLNVPLGSLRAPAPGGGAAKAK